MTEQTYPHPVGDFTAIGPECIASTPEPGPGTVINWQGAHFEYVPGFTEGATHD